jgi:hypothetical protein
VDAKELNGRLGLLRRSRKEFDSTPTFAAMDVGVRLMIAGMPNDKYDGSEWFGSMKGAGKFWTALNNHVAELSAALDCVPLGGDVTRDDYNDYISGYHRAFPKGRSGIATATRLLAMKRPDQFVCFDDRNKRGLCKDFGIPVSGMDYNRYWDEIIARVRDTPWWNAPPPTQGRKREIWQGRVAMLDAIFYKE